MCGKYWGAANCDNNLIVGNTCHNFNNAGSGTSWGITIGYSDCNENTVIGNSCRGNDTNFNNSGTSTFGDSTLNNFS